MGTINKPTPDAPSVGIPSQPQFLAMPQLIFMPQNGHLGMLTQSSASMYASGTIATQPSLSSQSCQPTSVSITQTAIPSTIQPQTSQLTVTTMPTNMVTTFMGKKMRAIAPKPMRSVSQKVSINTENTSLPIETVNLTPDVSKKKSIPPKSKKKKESPAKTIQSVPQVTQTAAPTYLQIPHAATSQSILPNSNHYITGQAQSIIYPPGFVSSNMAPVHYTQSLPSYPASSAPFIQQQPVVTQQQTPQITQVSQISQSEGTTVVQETEVVNLTADDDILALAWQNVNDGDLSFLNPSSTFDQGSALQFPQGEDPLDTFLRTVDNSGVGGFTNNAKVTNEPDQQSEESKGKSKKITKKPSSVRKNQENSESVDPTSKKTSKKKPSAGNKRSGLDKLENGVKETVVVDLQAMSSEANNDLATEMHSLASFDINIDLLKFTNEHSSPSENEPSTATFKESNEAEINGANQKSIYSSISNDKFFEDLAKMSPNNTLNDQSCADFLEQLTKEASSEIANDQEVCEQILQELVQNSPIVDDKMNERSADVQCASTNEIEQCPSNADQDSRNNMSAANYEVKETADKVTSNESDTCMKQANDAVQQSSTTYEITDTQSLEEMEQFLFDQLKDSNDEVVDSSDKCSNELPKTDVSDLSGLGERENVNEDVHNTTLDDDEFLSSLDVSFSNENAIECDNVASGQAVQTDRQLEITLNLMADGDLSEGISPIKTYNSASWEKLDRVLKSCQRQLVEMDESISSSNTTSSSSKIAASDMCDQHSELLPTDESYSHLFDQSSEKIAVSDCSETSVAGGILTDKKTVEVFSSSPAQLTMARNYSKHLLTNTDSSENPCKDEDSFTIRPRRGLPTSRRKHAKEKADKAISEIGQIQTTDRENSKEMSTLNENQTKGQSIILQDSNEEIKEQFSINSNNENDRVQIVDHPENSSAQINNPHDCEKSPIVIDHPTNAEISCDPPASCSREKSVGLSVPNIEDCSIMSSEAVDEKSLFLHNPSMDLFKSDNNVTNGLDVSVIDVVKELENSGSLQEIDTPFYTHAQENHTIDLHISTNNDTSREGSNGEDFSHKSQIVLNSAEVDCHVCHTPETFSDCQKKSISNSEEDSHEKPELVQTSKLLDDIPQEMCNKDSTNVSPNEISNDGNLNLNMESTENRILIDRQYSDNDDTDNLPLAVLSKQLSNQSMNSPQKEVESRAATEETHSPPQLTRHKNKRLPKKRKKTLSKKKERKTLMPSLEFEDLECKPVENEVSSHLSPRHEIPDCQNVENFSEINAEICESHADISAQDKCNTNNNCVQKSKRRGNSGYTRKRSKRSRKGENVSNDLENPLSIQIEECHPFGTDSEKTNSLNSLGLRNGPLFEALKSSPMFNKTVGFQSNFSTQVPSSHSSFSSTKFCEPNFGKIANDLPSFGDINQTKAYEPTTDDPSLDAMSNVFPSFPELNCSDSQIASTHAFWYNHKGSVLTSPNQILFSDAEKIIQEKTVQKNPAKKHNCKRKKGAKKKIFSKSGRKRTIKNVKSDGILSDDVCGDQCLESSNIENVDHSVDDADAEIIDVETESPVVPEPETCVANDDDDSFNKVDVCEKTDLIPIADSTDSPHDDILADNQLDSTELEKHASELSETPISEHISPQNSPDNLPECNKENETVNDDRNPADLEGSPEEPASPLFPPELTQEAIPEPEPLICVIPKLRIKKSKLKSKSKKKHRNKHHHNHAYSTFNDADNTDNFVQNNCQIPPNIPKFGTDETEEVFSEVVSKHNSDSTMISDKVSNQERPHYLPRLTMTLPTPRPLPKPAENTSPYYQRKNKYRIAAGVATKKIFSTCKEDRRSSFAQMNNYLQFGKTCGKKSKPCDENATPAPLSSSPNKSVSNHMPNASSISSPQAKRKRGRPRKFRPEESNMVLPVNSTPSEPIFPPAESGTTPSSQPPLKMRFKLSGQTNGYQVAIPSVVSANESGDDPSDTYRPQLSDHATSSHSRGEPLVFPPVNSPQFSDFEFMVAGEAEVFVDPHQAEVDREKNRNYVKKHRLKHRERHNDADEQDGVSKSKKKKHRHHNNQIYSQVDHRADKSSLNQCDNQNPTNLGDVLDTGACDPSSYPNHHINQDGTVPKTYHDQMHSQCWPGNINQQNMGSANLSHNPSPSFLQSPTGYDNYQSNKYQSTPDSSDKQLRSSHASSVSVTNWNNTSSLAFSSTPYPDQCGSASNTSLIHNNSLNKSRDPDCNKSDALLSPTTLPQDNAVSAGHGSSQSSQYSMPTPGYQPGPYPQENPMSNRSMTSPIKQAHSVGSGHALQSPAYHHSNPSSVSTPHCPPSNHSAAREEIDVGGPTRDSLPEPRLPDLSIEDSLPDVDHSTQNTGPGMLSHSSSENTKTTSKHKTSSDNSLKSSISNVSAHSRSRNHTPQPPNPAQTSSSFYNAAAFYNNPASGLRSSASPGPSTFSDWAASMYQAAAAQQHEAAYSQLASLYQHNYANASLYPAAAALRAHQQQNAAAAYQGGGGAAASHTNPWDFYSSNPLQAYSDYTGHSAAEMLAAHHLLSNNFSTPSAAVTSHQSAPHGARASPNMMVFGSTNPMLPIPAHQGSVSAANSVASTSSSMVAAAAAAAGFHPGFSMHNFP